MIIKDLDQIENLIKRAEKKFSGFFDDNLRRGFFKLLAAKDESFFETRSLRHLVKILLSQYFLQKETLKILAVENDNQRSVLAKIFK